MGKKKQSLDFQRNKARLGRKQVASNATDTSFKAKTVALPHQSILVERSGALRTARGQTLTDLRLAANHPNGGARKDAFQGMLSFLRSHEHLGLSASPAVLAIILPVTANHLADRDSGVRISVRQLLSWLLPRALPLGRALAPMADSLLFFIPGALSFDMAVKADAVRTMDTILAYLPASIRSSLAGKWNRMRLAPPASVGDDTGHAGTLLVGLLNMLGVALPTTARAPSKAGPVGAAGTIEVPLATRVATITALRRLLDIVYPGSDPSLPASAPLEETNKSDKAARSLGTCPTWFFAGDFASPSAWESFSRMLAPLIPGSKAPIFSMPPEEDKTVPPLPDTELMDLGSTLGSTLGADQLSAMVQSVARGMAGTESMAEGTDTAQDLFVLLAPMLTALYVEVAVEAVETLRSVSLLPAGAAASKAARTGSSEGGLDAHLDPALQAVFGITLLTRRLFRSMSLTTDAQTRGTVQHALVSLLSHMAKHFPLSIPALPAHVPGTQDGGKAYRKNEAALRATNLAYAELCVRAAHADRRSQDAAKPTQETTGSRRRHGGNASDGPDAKRRKVASGARAQASGVSNSAMRSVQLQHVSRYLLEVLRDQDNDGALALDFSSEEAGIDLDALESILPTVWLLLNLPRSNDKSEDPRSSQLLEALVGRFRTLPSSAPSKSPLFAFLARAAMADRFPSYTGTFHAAQVVDEEGNSPFGSFLREIPRYLWELAMGSSNASTRKSRSQPVLDFLRLAALDDGHEAFFADDLIVLQDMLVPFFASHNGKTMAQRINLEPVLAAIGPAALTPRLSLVVTPASISS